MEGHHAGWLGCAIGKFKDGGQARCLWIVLTALQRDGAFVEGQAIKARPIQAGEGFEVLEGAVITENLRVALDRVSGVVDAGAAAAALFGVAQMGC